MRNIKPDVTSAQLYKILSTIFKVQSIRLKQPNSSKFKTQFSTIITEEPNKLDFLKSCIKPDGPHKVQEFIDIFEGKPYITFCYPQRIHREWVKRNLSRRMGYGGYGQ
mmetsp:Transcript_4238/g.633  ORF Transcript_4238/g.633 Transcript_4238/m.633 type:complete len:108 (+) Transcript_4238:880-1203(+)